ncbi:MAG: ferredoxin family protein [Phycisphaerales bacterium]
MPHVIAEPCIGTKDTSCVDVCPVDCIHPGSGDERHDAADQLYIDPDTCIDCGLCVDECPVQAIFPEEDLPEEWLSYIAKNAEYFAAG